MAQPRISGLVRAMNMARDQLAAGLTPGEVDAFRANVTDTISQVDEICRRHGASPADLPAPSLRAYRFLRSIDMDALPMRTGEAAPPPPPVRVANLVASCNVLHDDLHDIARSWVGGGAASVADASDDIAAILARVSQNVSAVERICRDGGATPADLPAPSRRAHQWQRFLASQTNLRRHLDTLAMAIAAGDDARTDRAYRRRWGRAPLHVRLYHASTIFRVSGGGKAVRLQLSEGFVGAPRRVVKAVVRAALLGRPPGQMAEVKAYAASAEYAQVVADLMGGDAPSRRATRGRHFDLDTVFDRVNASYFDGQLSRPNLTWNRTATRRKLGHYEGSTDTVMVSLTLDHASVPDYVMDFVMYHELQHRVLGVKLVRGRHHAHTRAFRDAERAFADYDAAKAFIGRMDAELDW